MKIIFITTRYSPFLGVPVHLYSQLKPFIAVEECHMAMTVVVWSMIVSITTAELILVVRTWAIWGDSKKIGTILFAAVIACLPPILYAEWVYLRTITFLVYPYRKTPGCLVDSENSIFGICFVVIIAFDTCLLILTLTKAVKDYRMRRMVSVTVSRRISTVLYRDCVIFYVYLLGIEAVNLTVAGVAPSNLTHLLIVLQQVVHSTLSARVLIHLRQVHTATMDGSTVTTTNISDRLDILEFARSQVSVDIE